MKFNFRFEKLRKLKEIKEEEKQKEYFLHMQMYSESMNKLLDLKHHRDEAILRKKRIEKEGARAADFDVIERFLAGNKAQCIKVIGEIKERRKALELKKMELLEASKEKSIYDKLKENAFRAFRIDQEIKQINAIDEIATSHFGRQSE